MDDGRHVQPRPEDVATGADAEGADTEARGQGRELPVGPPGLRATPREPGIERLAKGADAEGADAEARGQGRELPVGFPSRHVRGEAPAVRDRAAWARCQAKRPLGETVAHARFLQDYFRRAVRVRPGCWSRGGMVGLWWARPQTKFRCEGGKNLAEGHEFETYHREVLRPCLDWYRGYVAALAR